VVAHGALVAIAALALGRLEVATDVGVTEVRGAGISVIANELLSGNTTVRRIAALGAVADVGIIATERFPGLAAGVGVTTLGAVAEIVVVTKKCASSLTGPLFAEVSGGANVAIAARGDIVVVGAAGVRVTPIIGAEIAVVAVGRGAR